MPFFGPLFNETIVDQRVLPGKLNILSHTTCGFPNFLFFFFSGLVRATAINASRAKRSMLTYYQGHYEERSRSLRSIVDNHRDRTTFEDFVTQVYSPAALENLYSSSGGGNSNLHRWVET